MATWNSGSRLLAVCRGTEAKNNKRKYRLRPLIVKLSLVAVIVEPLLIGYRLVEVRLIHDGDGRFCGFQGALLFERVLIDSFTN